MSIFYKNLAESRVNQSDTNNTTGNAARWLYIPVRHTDIGGASVPKKPKSFFIVKKFNATQTASISASLSGDASMIFDERGNIKTPEFTFKNPTVSNNSSIPTSSFTIAQNASLSQNGAIYRYDGGNIVFNKTLTYFLYKKDGVFYLLYNPMHRKHFKDFYNSVPGKQYGTSSLDADPDPARELFLSHIFANYCETVVDTSDPTRPENRYYADPTCQCFLNTKQAVENTYFEGNKVTYCTDPSNPDCVPSQAANVITGTANDSPVVCIAPGCQYSGYNTDSFYPSFRQSNTSDQGCPSSIQVSTCSTILQAGDDINVDDSTKFINKCLSSTNEDQINWKCNNDKVCVINSTGAYTSKGECEASCGTYSCLNYTCEYSQGPPVNPATAYDTEIQCTENCAPRPDTYSCNANTGQCELDPNSTLSLEECQAQCKFKCIDGACAKDSTGVSLIECSTNCNIKYSCVNNQCVVDPNGALTLEQCQSPSQGCILKYSCINGECQQDPNGTLTYAECVNTCISTGYDCLNGLCVPIQGGGKYISRNDCLDECGVSTYSCVDGECKLSAEGKYETESDCKNQCGVSSSDKTKKFRCVNNECKESPTGQYDTEWECLASCNPVKAEMDKLLGLEGKDHEYTYLYIIGGCIILLIIVLILLQSLAGGGKSPDSQPNIVVNLPPGLLPQGSQ